MIEEPQHVAVQLRWSHVMLSTLNNYFSLSKNVTTAGNFAINLLAKYRGNIVASNSFQQQCCLVYDLGAQLWTIFGDEL